MAKVPIPDGDGCPSRRGMPLWQPHEMEWSCTPTMVCGVEGLSSMRNCALAASTGIELDGQALARCAFSGEKKSADVAVPRAASRCQ